MKTVKVILGILFSFLVLNACSDDDTVDNNDIIGIWKVSCTEGYYKGNYIPVDGLEIQYTFLKGGTGTSEILFNSGSMQSENVDTQHSITWKINGNKLIIIQEGKSTEYIQTEKNSDYTKYNTYQAFDTYYIYVFRKTK